MKKERTSFSTLLPATIAVSALAFAIVFILSSSSDWMFAAEGASILRRWIEKFSGPSSSLSSGTGGRVTLSTCAALVCGTVFVLREKKRMRKGATAGKDKVDATDDYKAASSAGGVGVGVDGEINNSGGEEKKKEENSNSSIKNNNNNNNGKSSQPGSPMNPPSSSVSKPASNAIQSTSSGKKGSRNKGGAKDVKIDDEALEEFKLQQERLKNERLERERMIFEREEAERIA